MSQDAHIASVRYYKGDMCPPLLPDLLASIQMPLEWRDFIQAFMPDASRITSFIQNGDSTRLHLALERNSTGTIFLNKTNPPFPEVKTYCKKNKKNGINETVNYLIGRLRVISSWCIFRRLCPMSHRLTLLTYLLTQTATIKGVFSRLRFTECEDVPGWGPAWAHGSGLFTWKGYDILHVLRTAQNTSYLPLRSSHTMPTTWSREHTPQMHT